MGSSCSDPGEAATSYCPITYGSCVGNQISISCFLPSPTFFGCGEQYVESIMNIPNTMIPDGHTITDVNVWALFDHTWVGDVEGGLFHDSKVRKLFDPSGCSNNDFYATFDDSSSGSIIKSGTGCDQSSSPAYTGTHRPLETLSYFNGDAANGQWKLEVQDSVDGLDGTFHEWGIQLTIPTYCSESPTPAPTDNPTPSPTNLPTTNPTKYPSSNPSKYPSINPSKNPSGSPTTNPSKYPSISPTTNPSKYPSTSPTRNPSISPSAHPSNYPSRSPSKLPTLTPTVENAIGVDEQTTNLPTTQITGAGNNKVASNANSSQNDETMLQNILFGLAGIVLITFCLLIIFCVLYQRRKRRNILHDFKATHEMVTSQTELSDPGSLGATSINFTDMAGENDMEDTGSNENITGTEPSAAAAVGAPIDPQLHQTNMVQNMNMMGNLNMMQQMMDQMNVQMMGNMNNVNMNMNVIQQPSEPPLPVENNNGIGPFRNDQLQAELIYDTPNGQNVVTSFSSGTIVAVADNGTDSDDDGDNLANLYGKNKCAAETVQ